MVSSFDCPSYRSTGIEPYEWHESLLDPMSDPIRTNPVWKIFVASTDQNEPDRVPQQFKSYRTSYNNIREAIADNLG